MKHVSMLSPQEPAYRLRLEQNKLKWAKQEQRATQLEMEAADQLKRFLRRPWRDDWNDRTARGDHRAASSGSRLGPWR